MKNGTVAILLVILVAGSLGVGYFAGNSNRQTITTTITSSIGLKGFSLCSANCVYPSPYLSGSIYFNIPAPMKSLQLIVNGTDQDVQQWKCCSLTQFVLGYKGGFQNPQVVKGDSYVLEFMATFVDNSTASATTTVVAS